MARTGRRPGGADTRTEIVDAARAQFAEQGYDATSLRAIARAAAVDPALVHHYFAGKSALFAEVMQLPLDPSTVLPAVLDVPLEELGRSLTRFFLGLWESPDSGAQMVAWVRVGLGSEDATAQLRGFVTSEILARFAARLPDQSSAARRAALAGTQLIGAAIGRYLIRAEALVALDLEEYADAVGAAVQAHLTGAGAAPG